MKLERDENLKLEMSSAFPQANFTINMSPEAFELLSKGIYPDPIKAVIRELSTNATDSHIQAEEGVKKEDGTWLVRPMPHQRKKPFDIVMPTSMSPIFKIRDYGTGLSEEGVMKLYTTYFGSTKQQTNTQTGQKGLGSKSPFALVSSFLVISYFNGVQTVYSALKGEDGFPAIVKMHSNPTQEPNGLEINITVSPGDTSNFMDRAAKIYTFFDVIPHFKGQAPTITPIEYTHVEKTWALRKEYQKARGIPCGLVEGQICYPIETPPLEGKIRPNLLSMYNQWKDILELRLPIGSTNSVASREGLEYNKHTIASIEKVLLEVVDKLKFTVQEKIANAETYVEAINIICSLPTREAAFLDALYVKNDVKWGKRVISKTDPAIRDRKLVLEDTFTQIRSEYDNALLGTKRYLYNKYVPPYRIFGGDGEAKKDTSTFNDKHSYGNNAPTQVATDKSDLKLTHKVHHNFSVGYKYHLILNDGKVAYFKLKNYIKNNYKIFGGYTHRVIVFGPKELNLLVRVQDLLGIKTHILTSSWVVPSPEKVKKDVTIRVFTPYQYCLQAKTNSWDADRKFSCTSVFNNYSDVPADAVYYITTSGSAFNFTHIHKSLPSYTSPEHLNEILAGLQLLIGEPSLNNIVVFPESSKAKFLKDYPKLKPLGDYFDTLPKYKLTSDQKLAVESVIHYNDPKYSHAKTGKNEVLITFLTFLANSALSPTLKSWAKENLELYNKADAKTAELHKLGANKGCIAAVELVKDWWKQQLATPAVSTSDKIKVEAGVNNVFPIFNVVKHNMRDAINTHVTALIHYTESDWHKYKETI